MLAAVVVEHSVPSLSCGFQRASRPHQSAGLFYVCFCSDLVITLAFQASNTGSIPDRSSSVFVMVRDYFYHLKINANDDLMLAAA